MFTGQAGWALPEFLLLAEFGGTTAPPAPPCPTPMEAVAGDP